MANIHAWRRTEGAEPARGFTLIELLVVIAIIAILAAMLLPAMARAKQKAQTSNCVSNLKQAGQELEMYTQDCGESLPGPVWVGARASYDENSSSELVFYLATYLGNPAPWPDSHIADVFVCPGYKSSAPEVTSMEGRKCYLLKPFADSPVNQVRPFGYPSPFAAPLKAPQLETYGSPSSIFAITDVDKINIPDPTVSWWSDLPYKPVHGDVRIELYFDWHVAAKKVAW